MAEIVGTEDDDELTGNVGNDTIDGLGGNDIIWGGDDPAVPLREFREDTLNGGAGNDIIHGGRAGDTIDGGDGNDIIDGGLGWSADRIDGGDGDDIIYAMAGSQVTGGAGIDTVHIRGYSFGSDTHLSSVEVIYGGPGDESIAVQHDSITGPVAIYGGNGDDVISGTEFDDTLFGGAGRDFIYAGDGDDVVRLGPPGEGDHSYGQTYGFGGGQVAGMGGDDILYGSSGEDNLIGGFDNDRVVGGDAADWLFGETGDDILRGGEGDDFLAGSYGRDVLVGGGGADEFYFDDGDFAGPRRADADRILDFDRGEGDFISFVDFDADNSTEERDDFTFIGAQAFSQTAGELRYEWRDGRTWLQGDTDGDGVANFMIRIDGEITLTEDCFLF